MNQRIDQRLSVVEEHAARIPPPRSAEVAEGERAFLDALGIADWSELPCDDLHRIIQLSEEAPDFAHPLIVKACIAWPEDREPAAARAMYRHLPRRPDNVPWEDPRVGPPHDTPEWRALKLWERRRWGYMKVENDPEAAVIAERLRAWSTAADRPYLHGTDLTLMLTRLGIDWPRMNYLQLRRLSDLCAALDQLTLEQGAFEAPAGVWYAVVGWEAGHPRRRAA